MKTISSRAALRAELAPARRRGLSIGLVPTMGAFHEGHLALMRRACERCDVVVVSLFVNPSQFAPGEDLAAYPRDLARDAALAAAQGVALLFTPDIDELYPDGFATWVTVDAGLSERLCGATRGAGHFRGVTTIVTKLLNIVGPDVAFFGQKDAQQATIIRRLVADLDLPTAIEVCPTVREPDGLAMSSRNGYLNGPERARATALFNALEAGRRAAGAGERDAAAIVAAARVELERRDVAPEYLELVSPETLAPLARLDGEGLLAVAARVGPARLIDNALIAVDLNGSRPA